MMKPSNDFKFYYQLVFAVEQNIILILKLNIFYQIFNQNILISKYLLFLKDLRLNLYLKKLMPVN